MKFWGVEVKPGQTVYCDPGEGRVVHLTQVALGETEKGSVGILVSAKIGDQKGVIGTLSAENHPHIPCDLIFEKQFELSHSSKTASVFACGYKIPMHNCTPDSSESDSSEFDSSESDSSESDSSESDSSEDEVETVNNQVTNRIVGNVAKPPTTKDDKKVTDNHDSGEDDSDFYSTDSDDYDDDGYSSLDTDSEEDGTSSEEMDTSSKEEGKDSPKPEDGKKAVAETALKTPASDDTSSKEGSSEEGDKNTRKPEDGEKTVAAETALKTPASDDTSNKETPASDDTSNKEDTEEDKNTPKPEVGTKRAAEAALEKPAPDKKAKIETPSGQDTEDKKTVHVATPHPAKQADKAPGNGKQNLKSKYVGGAHACKSCSRTFGSISALQSHEKAKHA